MMAEYIHIVIIGRTNLYWRDNELVHLEAWFDSLRMGLSLQG